MALPGAEMSSQTLGNISGFLTGGFCWFTASSGASGVPSETGPCVCRAGTEWGKRVDSIIAKAGSTSLRGSFKYL